MPRNEPTKKDLYDQLDALKAELDGYRARDLVMLSVRVPRNLRDELGDIAREQGVSLQDLVQDSLTASTIATISEAHRAPLDVVANQQGLTRSEVVTEAISAYIKAHHAKTKRQTTNRKRTTKTASAK